MIARNVGKKSLAVDVYKKNVSAQRLYAKHGFTFTQDARIRGMMRGNKLL